jgi:hypothetical protein
MAPKKKTERKKGQQKPPPWVATTTDGRDDDVDEIPRGGDIDDDFQSIVESDCGDR